MPEQRSAVPHRVCVAAASFGLLGGAVTFAGWATGTYRLTDWIGGGITMKANPALAAAAAGAGLLAYALAVRGRNVACRLLGLLWRASGA